MQLFYSLPATMRRDTGDGITEVVREQFSASILESEELSPISNYIHASIIEELNYSIGLALVKDLEVHPAAYNLDRLRTTLSYSWDGLKDAIANFEDWGHLPGDDIIAMAYDEQYDDLIAFEDWIKIIDERIAQIVDDTLASLEMYLARIRFDFRFLLKGRKPIDVRIVHGIIIIYV